MSENNQMMSLEGQLVGMPLAGPESFSQQQLDYLKRALGVDETVLYYNSDGANGTLQLSENYDNFDRLRVEWDVWSDGDYKRNISELPTSVSNCILYASYFNSANSNCFNMLYTVSLSSNSFSVLGGRYNSWTNNTVTNVDSSKMSIYKIVGIHRIAGGN